MKWKPKLQPDNPLVYNLKNAGVRVINWAGEESLVANVARSTAGNLQWAANGISNSGLVLLFNFNIKTLDPGRKLESPRLPAPEKLH